jgi:hypothetical protein
MFHHRRAALASHYKKEQSLHPNDERGAEVHGRVAVTNFIYVLARRALVIQHFKRVS